MKEKNKLENIQTVVGPSSRLGDKTVEGTPIKKNEKPKQSTGQGIDEKDPYK
jgi:hypothetical protein